jgi:hypothetical protein
MAAFFVLLGCSAAFSISCDECQDIIKEIRTIDEDVKTRRKDLDEANKNKEYKKVVEINEEITRLRRKIVDLQRTSDPCREACTPERIQFDKCNKIKLTIVEMESASSGRGEENKKIDELYRSLLECNKELRRLQRTAR